MENIVSIIDKEYGDIKNNTKEFCDVTYTIYGKDRERESKNPNNFLKYELSEELKQISIRLYSKYKRISLNLYIKGCFNSNFIVEGNDKIWIYGITNIIDNIFKNKKHKTYNRFLNSKKALVISLPLGIVYGILTSMLTNDPLFKIFGIVSMAICIPLNIHLHIFPWLYPKIETEHMRQVRIRKCIKSFLSAIGLGIIANYIWQNLPQ